MGFIAEWRRQRSTRSADVRAEGLVREGRRLLTEGQATDAEVLLAEAVRLRTAWSGPAAPDAVATRMTRARALHRLGRTAEAEAELRDIVGIVAATPSLESLGGSARVILAGTLLASQRAQEALTELDALLEGAGSPSPDRTFFRARSMRSVALSTLGRHAEAAEESLALAGAIAAEHGARDLGALRARASRTQNLVQLGSFDETESECRALIEAVAGLDGAQASVVDRSARNALVLSLVGRGRAVEGESEAREAIRLASTPGLPGHTYPVALHLGLARALNAQGRHAEALHTAQAAEEAYVGTPDANIRLVAAVRLAIGTAQLGLARLDEARPATDLALADCLASLGPHHHRTLEADTLNGRLLATEGRLDEARAQLATNAAAWQRNFGADHPDTRAAVRALAAVG